MKAKVLTCKKWVDDIADGYMLTIRLENGSKGIVDAGDNSTKYEPGEWVTVEEIERNSENVWYKIV
jgi:hypothetical protein